MSLILTPYAVAPSDPYYASVTSLLHCDGADGAQVFTDQKGLTWLPHSGGANSATRTAAPKFGTAAIDLDGAGKWGLVSAADANTFFNVGASTDFTLEVWTRFAASGGVNFGYWFTTEAIIRLLVRDSTSKVELFLQSTTAANSSEDIGTTVLSSDTYHHLAVSRVSGTVRVFINGVLEITRSFPYSLAATAGQKFSWGRTNANPGPAGYFDEARLTVGVGRYTGAFTPPTAAFPNQ